MTHLFIRTCEKDDYLARLCYESWLLAGFKGNVIFLAENYTTQYLNDCGQFKVRKSCANFGGERGVNVLVDCLRDFQFFSDDMVITCDADVIIKKIPDLNIDFGGAGGLTKHGWVHISGQLQIFRGSVLKQILEQPVEETWREMDSKGYDVLDDTYMSYCAYKLGVIPKTYHNYWIHDKFYQHQGNTDFKEVIKEIWKQRS